MYYIESIGIGNSIGQKGSDIISSISNPQEFVYLIMNIVASPWLLYLQWGYALWQYIQGYPVVKLLLKLPTWLILYRWRKRRVILLNEMYDDLQQDIDVNIFRPGDERNGIKIIAKDGYWIKARFFDENMIVHQNQLIKIWFTDFNDDFVIDKVDVTDSISIARKVSTKEAMVRIAAAFKTTEVKTICIYSPEHDINLNKTLGKFVGLFPLIAQSKGFTRESAWLSISILILNVTKIPLYKVYNNIFERLSLLIMLHIFKKRSWLYQMFSLFSDKWSYGDKTKRFVYNGKDNGFLVHTVAIFKGINDYELTFGYGDYDSHYPISEDQHFFIDHKRIYALPIPPRMGHYCKVICRIDAFVINRVESTSQLYPKHIT